MGIFDSFFESGGFVPIDPTRADGDSDFGLARNLSGLSAADSSLRAAELSVAEQARQFDAIQENLQPFVNIARQLLPGLAERDLNSGLLSLFTDPRLRPLFRDATREAENSVAGAGLRRSGAGLSAIADAPQNLALSLEQELRNRQQELVGLGSTTGVQLGGLGSFASQGIGDTLQGGLLGAGQARADGGQNLVNLASALVRAFGGR